MLRPPEALTVGATSGFHPRIAGLVEECQGGFDAIPEARRADLDRLAVFVREHARPGDEARLTFICTHNSRRSHLAQVWAQVAAAHYGVDHVASYSGGTEATAVNPRTLASLERAGFVIRREGEGPNPRYAIGYAEGLPPVEAFSKVYDQAPNPRSGFAAVMTCSDADEGCPFVPGAALRVATPYVDPKEADGTPREAEVYDERSLQIATEMLYLFSRVRS